MPHRRHPAEELHTRRNHDHQARRREEALAHLRNACGEHVMDPHAKADESGRHNGQDNRRVAENVPATENWD